MSNQLDMIAVLKSLEHYSSHTVTGMGGRSTCTRHTRPCSRKTTGCAQCTPVVICTPEDCTGMHGCLSTRAHTCTHTHTHTHTHTLHTHTHTHTHTLHIHTTAPHTRPGSETVINSWHPDPDHKLSSIVGIL